jgi:hypothetical protein
MSTEFTNRQWRLPNAWNGSESNVNKQSNYSMDFDGSSYVEVGHLNLTRAFSLSFWGNYTTSGNGINIISQNQTGQATFGMYQLTDGKIRFWVTSSGSYNASNEITANTATNNGNWNNIILINDGTNLKIYINGILDNSSSNGVSSPYNGTANFWIGGSQAGGAKFEGKIDAVSIYNYALSASQITTLYGSSSTGIGNPMSLSPKPVAYYPLGDQDAFNGSNYLVPNSSLKDYVFDFDGSTSYITTSVNPSNYSALTASAWINFDSTTGRQSVFSQYQDNTNNVSSMWMLWNVVSNELWFFIIDSSNVFKTAKWTSSNSFTLTTGNWYNVVGIWDGSYVKVYVNGEAGSYSDAATSLNSSSLDFLIGSGMTSGGGIPYDEFNGKISNVQVFNTALPATGSNSVETLYNNGSPLTSMSGFTSLQGWWKLDASATYDGTNWTIEDSSSNSNDGTSSGMTQANLVQSDLSFTSGYSPYALNFDAAGTDRINFGNPTNLQITSSFSVSVWINQTPATDHATVISKDAFSTTRCWGLKSSRAPTSNFVMFYLFDPNNNAFNVESNIRVDDGKWHHLTAVYEAGNSVKIYIDGSLNNTNSTSIPSSIANKNADIILGEAHTSGYYEFGGSISNCSIWNTALTSAQVSEIYNEGVPSNLNNHSAYSNLVSWWQLGSNSSFNTNWTVLDEKGSNNGTSSNMGEDAIVDGVGSYANGLSSGMGGDEIIGDAPYSTANSLSVNMDVLDRVEDTPA